MRRKDSTGRTLRLRRETLRRLALRDGDLRRVAGGSWGGVDPETGNPGGEWTDSETLSTVSRFC
ncbi:MAG TPA: hypothetical protein VFU21_30520 [Kofleriaceae bacterium]|nr:hypothetical protein [Kofleriaceae bacterium]